jgi:molybdopterin-binding protein
MSSHVSVDIGQGSILTASITNEAVADLGFKVGDGAWAIIKASEVMVGKSSLARASRAPDSRKERGQLIPRETMLEELFRERAECSRGATAAEPHRD